MTCLFFSLTAFFIFKNCWNFFYTLHWKFLIRLFSLFLLSDKQQWLEDERIPAMRTEMPRNYLISGPGPHEDILTSGRHARQIPTK